MLQGGFLPVTANLVEGAPGTGKSTLGMQFIHAGAAQFDAPGLILTFEEFPQQYYQSAASFCWDLRSLEAANKLRVIMTSPEVSHLDFSTNEQPHCHNCRGNWCTAYSGRQSVTL